MKAGNSSVLFRRALDWIRAESRLNGDFDRRFHDTVDVAGKQDGGSAVLLARRPITLFPFHEANDFAMMQIAQRVMPAGSENLDPNVISDFHHTGESNRREDAYWLI